MTINFDDLWDYEGDEIKKIQCTKCSKEIKVGSGYCRICGIVSQDAIERDMACVKRRKERLKGEAKIEAEKDFTDNMCEVIFSKLPSLNKVSIKDLVKIMWQEGMLKVPDNADERQYITDCGGMLAWAKKRAIGLAKWWKKNQVAFIGTLHTQGHGYCIYMPDSKEAKEAGFKSKAEWSVQNLRKFSENVDSSDIDNIDLTKGPQDGS